MDTCDRSLPIFLHRRFQRLRDSVSGLGQGSFVLRPVMLRVRTTLFAEEEQITRPKLIMRILSDFIKEIAQNLNESVVFKITFRQLGTARRNVTIKCKNSVSFILF